MKVETFECAETAAEPIEASEEAIRLIQEMGLDGQHELVTRPDKSNHDSRCPYREMTQDEAFVYGVLCPSHTSIGRYSASPLPLRVLQVAAHAKSLGVFKEIEVWDKIGQDLKDPVLVGVTTKKMGSGTSTWNSDVRYILARWGEELETFSTLLKRAIAKKREKIASALKKIKAEVMSKGENGENYTDDEIIRHSATFEPYCNL